MLPYRADRNPTGYPWLSLGVTTQQTLARCALGVSVHPQLLSVARPRLACAAAACARARHARARCRSSRMREAVALWRRGLPRRPAPVRRFWSWTGRSHSSNSAFSTLHRPSATPPTREYMYNQAPKCIERQRIRHVQYPSMYTVLAYYTGTRGRSINS